MRVYMGWDWHDAAAYATAVQSIEEQTANGVEIIPVYGERLRKMGLYHRPYRVSDGHHDGEINGQMYDVGDGKPFSSDFSFARFAVPMLEDYGKEWVLFCDPDVLFRADIEGLFDLADDDYGVMCVKHVHEPEQETKMWGVAQTLYRRKNWSSVMLMRPNMCRGLTQYVLNTARGSALHAMTWIEDELIGELPVEWNWLEGWSDPEVTPNLVHFTAGTPDLPGCEDAMYAEEWRAAWDRAERSPYLP